MYIQNAFGFSFGGPIKKDKLFFFGTFQPTLTRIGAANGSAVIPTQQGFNTLRSLFPQDASANLDRYLGVVGGLRGSTNPFNVPLGGGRPDVQFGTVTASAPAPINTYDLLARIDWTPNERDNFAARYIFNDQVVTNQFPTPFQGFAVDVPGRVQNFYANYTRILSSRMTNELRFSYGRFNVLFGAQDPAALNFGPQFLFSGASISGVGILGGLTTTFFPQGRVFNNYQLQDTITYTSGAHTIRAGTDMMRQIAKQFVPFNAQGTLTFSAGGGFPAFGNFVDGFSGTQGTFAAITFGSPVDHPNAFQQAYFVNDTWRSLQSHSVALQLLSISSEAFRLWLSAPCGHSLSSAGAEPEASRTAPTIGACWLPSLTARTTFCLPRVSTSAGAFGLPFFGPFQAKVGGVPRRRTSVIIQACLDFQTCMRFPSHGRSVRKKGPYTSYGPWICLAAGWIYL